MQSNLSYILLLLWLFCLPTINAQETRNKDISNQKTITNSSSDSLLIEQLDTVKLPPIKTDSIRKPKEVIESVITHDAKDYSIQNAKNKTVTLYNKAHVTYTDIDLKAGIIIVDYKNNTVYAKGIKDSTAYKQRPVFKQGSQVTEQDSIIYNFKTEKALVYGIKTEQSGIITYGNKMKRVNDSTIYLRKIRFTTSRKKIPDYYIATGKAKLVPGKKIIVGGSNLVLADVPTPLYLPFAYFPLTKGRTSGFIIPTWGDTRSQGFFLQNGGYYLALSDYFDLTLLGDIYTNGSWGLRGETNYYVRYKYSGGFNIQFQNNIQGIKGLSNYRKSSTFNVRWNHSQDTKSSPHSRFSASVNLGSSKFFKESLNEINNSQFLQNTLSSSISYYKKIVGTPFNMNVALSHSQNTSTEDITMTFPSLQLTMERINPFQGKGGIQKNAFQKIGINYNMQGEYRIKTKDSLFLKPEMFRTAKTGIQHNLSANTNMKVFKYFTLSPSANYKDVWYFNKIKKRYDPNFKNKNTFGKAVNDTINGFTRFNEYNIGVALSTSIYGTFNFKKGRLKAIRHTIRPSISYGYRPDFADKHNLQVLDGPRIDNVLNYSPFQNGYIPSLENNYIQPIAEGPQQKLITYSPFEKGIYGTPSSGLSNSIGISVNNVLEAKVAPKDPDSDEEDKRITILNNLNFSTRYNFAADSLRWSNVSASAGTRLFKDKMAVNLSASLDPYQVNTKGERINQFNKDLFRVASASLTANYSLSSKDFEDKKDTKDNGNGAQETPDVFGENMPTTNSFAQRVPSKSKETQTKEAKLYKAKIPWTVGLTYSMGYSNNGIKSGISNNSLMFSGDIEPSPKWKIGYSSGYDFDENGFTPTTLTFARDLDSWRFNFRWNPFGFNSSYYFFIGVKSSVLSDLKWDKNKPPDRVLF